MTLKLMLENVLHKSMQMCYTKARKQCTWNKLTCKFASEQNLLASLHQNKTLQCEAMDGDTKAIMEKLLAEKIGINKKLQGILPLLTLANYAYGIKLRPSALMVHDKNRGGATLNAWDVHRKGAAILDAGLQPKLVIPSSICIEMASDGESRKRQLNANQNLAATSSGMLPAPIGDERYLKLGNSHWVMFCKALQAGCVNPKGQQLHTPAELEKLMAEGWERQAISEKVEQPFPSFPSLCQSALNSVNSNATSTGELEAMLQLASYLKSGATLSDAVEAVHAAQPVCGHYLQDIATFVKLYTGGEDFPLLDQLKGFCVLIAYIHIYIYIFTINTIISQNQFARSICKVL